MRLHEEEKPELVEAAPTEQPAMWLGQPATTWHQTDLSKVKPCRESRVELSRVESLLELRK
jgi:hypothetical protein